MHDDGRAIVLSYFDAMAARVSWADLSDHPFFEEPDDDAHRNKTNVTGARHVAARYLFAKYVFCTLSIYT